LEKEAETMVVGLRKMRKNANEGRDGRAAVCMCMTCLGEKCSRRYVLTGCGEIVEGIGRDNKEERRASGGMR
jgi:hypothetical protein